MPKERSPGQGWSIRIIRRIYAVYTPFTENSIYATYTPYIPGISISGGAISGFYFWVRVAWEPPVEKCRKRPFSSRFGRFSKFENEERCRYQQPNYLSFTSQHLAVLFGLKRPFLVIISGVFLIISGVFLAGPLTQTPHHPRVHPLIRIIRRIYV